MAMELGSKQGVKGDINVTPLIDVVLVLLIIFMVLTPSVLKHLTAVVPKKSDDIAHSVDSVIIVGYTANRELTVNGEPVVPEALGGKLAEHLRAAPQKAVFFKADDDAPYGEVVHLLDAARGSGAVTLAVLTR